MDHSPLQLALRDLRRQLTHPTGLTLLVGIAAILAILGPFGTVDRLGLVQRFLFWGAMAAGTYAIGAVVGAALGPRVWPRLGHWPSVGIVGLATGLAVLPFVVLLNWITFDFVPRGEEWLRLGAPILAIAVIVTASLQAVERHLSQDTPPAGPALLDRLPLDKRAALVALSVEDHYVRVRTLKGEEMLLMRLGDAIRETTPVPGLQVHRSHWVALSQVTAARREGDRAVLTMTTGPEVPVSRANVPAVRDAGLLPR